MEIDVDIRNVFSVLSNHPAQTQAVVDIASSLLGASQVAADYPPFMASEDFADMLNIVPGAHFFIGQENTAPLHNPSYEFDDDIIPVGAALLASIVQTRSSSLR
ncbi:hypothetical protein RRU01S_01_00270 [Agrobacterium rubi TR3 = NBRC 13261]|uniref:Peptidase M20 family protein n=1 Tax=Agrobacterium rubi TR3 = NBRC 13261 TaxID=1368415 RepID=A0A081CPK4_9HYPH|nr:M20/M25/M40 family metallo-hydrolase [Agrobacterium rubi]MBP1877600.1 metal-dependent amidase/aminoacylase/carboxypeptidase family protein [Agrobacterium rubi]MCL6654087.1 hypothetical protein [Agrobacterium rubi]GAK68600.1 hypothetical protein RRU01S_01_00270 [Agrobacterium rubi TR3 = NBRC 13261]